MASLRLLSQSVKAARAAAPAACSAPVLLRLENNIHNYQLILTNLQLSVSRRLTGKRRSFSQTPPAGLGVSERPRLPPFRPS